MGLNDHHTLHYGSFGGASVFVKLRLIIRADCAMVSSFLLDTWTLHGVLLTKRPHGSHILVELDLSTQNRGSHFNVIHSTSQIIHGKTKYISIPTNSLTAPNI